MSTMRSRAARRRAVACRKIFPAAESSTMVVRGLAQVVHAHLDEARLARPAHDAVLERAGKKAGENGDDVETERHRRFFLTGESTLKGREAAQPLPAARLGRAWRVERDAAASAIGGPPSG